MIDKYFNTFKVKLTNLQRHVGDLNIIAAPSTEKLDVWKFGCYNWCNSLDDLSRILIFKVFCYLGSHG